MRAKMQELKYTIRAASCFAVIALALVCWQAFMPGDQIKLLSLLALPIDLFFFFAASPLWSGLLQTACIVLLGVFQYGLIGYCFDRCKSNWSSDAVK